MIVYEIGPDGGQTKGWVNLHRVSTVVAYQEAMVVEGRRVAAEYPAHSVERREITKWADALSLNELTPGRYSLGARGTIVVEEGTAMQRTDAQWRSQMAKALLVRKRGVPARQVSTDRVKVGAIRHKPRSISVARAAAEIARLKRMAG